VGAGSGSVAIEAAQLASGGTVFAIEMDPDDYQLIAANADRFAVTNLTPVLGKAPEAWVGLPAPDAVFVGGTGRVVTSIVESAFAPLRPGGRIVANVSSLENVTAVFEILRELCGDANVCMINLARGVQQLERLRFESTNPSFLISAVKGS
jgi:precorrin-6Y C5,15-methyltransferase (decarboxylating)